MIYNLLLCLDMNVSICRLGVDCQNSCHVNEIFLSDKQHSNRICTTGITSTSECLKKVFFYLESNKDLQSILNLHISQQDNNQSQNVICFHFGRPSLWHPKLVNIFLLIRFPFSGKHLFDFPGCSNISMDGKFPLVF